MVTIVGRQPRGAANKYRAAIPLFKRLIAFRDAAAKEASKPADPLDGLKLTSASDEEDEPGDLDASLRRAVRLADLADDPALRPTEADLAFLKRLKAVPAEATLAVLDGLRKLDLRSTPVDDAGMAYLRGLVNLKAVDLMNSTMLASDSKLTDAGLDPLRRLTDLRELNLTGTAIRGPGLAHLAGMTVLARLDLSHTLIEDAGLAHLPTFPKLRHLNLSGTKITDAALPALRRQTGLRYLGLLGTKISAAGVEELRRGRVGLRIHEPDGSSVP